MPLAIFGGCSKSSACRGSRSGSVNGSTMQPVELQPGRLADDVPQRNVDRGGNADDCFAAPALLVRQALPVEREDLSVETFRRERVGADDEVGNPGAVR
jgi:hypothetical protein